MSYVMLDMAKFGVEYKLNCKSSEYCLCGAIARELIGL